MTIVFGCLFVYNVCVESLVELGDFYMLYVAKGTGCVRFPFRSDNANKSVILHCNNDIIVQMGETD